jgi:hypothetical protein
MYGMHMSRFWCGLAVAGIAAGSFFTSPAAADEERVQILGVINGGGPSDSHRVEVRIEDGDIFVSVDGEEIPVERIRAKDGRIMIVDEDGNEISLFGIMRGDDDEGWSFRLGDDHAHDWVWQLGRPHEDAAAPAPKVMLGIHMSQPGKALEHHLRLEPGTTTMITALYEDLPAHEAGLREFDIIVAVDGRRPADPKSIREALADKEPGDSVTLTVIQEGETRKVRAVLDEFDQEQMRSAHVIGTGPEVEIFLDREPADGRLIPPIDWREFVIDPDTSRLFRMLERPTRKHLEELEEQWAERAPRELEERLERLNDRIGELKEMLEKLIDQAREFREESATRD